MNRLAQIITTSLFVVILAACGSAPVSQSTVVPPSQVPTVAPTELVAPTEAAPSVTPATTAGISVTDSLAREVTIPATAQRIVSLAPSITEILFAVGAGPQVVGNTQYCNYPPEADALPEIGGFSAKTISVEAIVALNPDLVIGGSTNQAAIAEALEDLGVATLIFEPTTFDTVYANIAVIGEVTGHTQEAGALITTMQARVAAVLAKIATIPAADRPTVFYEIFDEPLLTAGPSTFIGQMLTMVGASNIFADTSENYPQVSAEAIVERNPAVIIGPDSHGDKLTPDHLASRPGWDQIRAVQDKRIYLLDGDMASRAGPRLVEVLESLAATLYPEQFQ